MKLVKKASATIRQPKNIAASRSHARARLSTPSVLALLVGADQLALGEHVAFHRLLELGLGRPVELERGVERIQLEEVAVPPDGRARPAVVLAPEVVHAGARALRQLA